MNRALILLVLLVLAAPVWGATGLKFAPSAGGSWELLDTILARVDDDVVTLGDVNVEMELLKRSGQADSGALTRHGVVNDLVRRKLLVTEAEKLRMHTTPGAVRAEMAKWEEGSGDAEQFQTAMEALGLRQADLERRAEQMLLWKAYVALKRETTYVPESAVRNFYFKQVEVYGDRPLAEVHDEIRNYLAFKKYQTEFNRWVDKQVSLGRVRILEFPDEENY